MIASSRPLRFVALLLGGWVTMRTAQLWPVAGPIAAIVPVLLDVVATPAEAETSTDPAARRIPAPRYYLPEIARLHAIPAGTVAVIRLSRATVRLREPGHPAGAILALARPETAQMAHGPIGSPMLVSVVPDSSSRLKASLWGIVRGGGAASPFAPQLGEARPVCG